MATSVDHHSHPCRARLHTDTQIHSRGTWGFKVHMMRQSIRIFLLFLTGAAYIASYGYAYSRAVALGIGMVPTTSTYQSHVAISTYILPLTLATVLCVVFCLQLPALKSVKLQLIVIGIISFCVSLWVISRPLTLSLDTYRYLWDGHLLVHGVSPYRAVPLSPVLDAYRNFRYWPLVGWKTTPDAYPPLSQIYFVAAAAIKDGALWPYRTIAFVNQCVSLVLYLIVLKKRARPHGLQRKDIFAFALFALFPPVINELIGASHVDTFAVPWLLLAWWMWLENRPLVVGIALGLATLIKLWPIVLIPAFWRWGEKKSNALMIASGGITLIAGFAPFMLLGHGHVFAFYHKDLFFDESLYFPVRRFIQHTRHGATVILAVMELLAWTYMLSKRGRALTFEQKVTILGMTFLLSSPMLRPWYPIPLIPFAALAGDFSVFYLSVSIQTLGSLTPREFFPYLPIEFIPTYAAAIFQWFVQWPRAAVRKLRTE